MNRYLIAFIAGALFLSAAFSLGYRYRKAQEDHAEVKQLQSDAKAVDKLEDKTHAEKERVVTIFKTIQKESKHEDCLNQPYPASVSDGLRSAGIGTRSTVN